MFLDFFLFELKLRFKSISTYCYLALWTVLAFLFVGLEDFSPIPAGKILLNGPYATQLYDIQMTFFGAIIIAAVFGTSILRDFQRDTYQIIFTKPITKLAYLGGRWAGSLVTTLVIFLGIPLGEAIGGFSPWTDHARIAPLNLAMLAYHYAVIVAPEIFFLGTVFFLVAALTRRVIVVYLQGAALYAIYFIGLIAVSQTRSLKPFWPAVFDPIGLLLEGSVTRYWTVADRNTLWMPIHDMFLWNRVVWGSAGLVALVALFAFFPMSAEALTSRRSRKQRREAQESTAPPLPKFHNSLPIVSTTYSFSNTIQQLASLTKIYFRNIFREIPFWAITMIMVVICMSNGHFAGNRNDSNVWPVTYYMLEAIEGGGVLFLFIIATMYAGELVWRERDTHFEQIHDALPYRSWIDTLGKLFALCAAEIFLLTVVMFCGVLSQTISGYYHYEFLQYFKELYLVTFPQVLIFALLAFFLQTIVSNKFVGHGIAIGIFLIPTILERVGFSDRLYLYDDIVAYTYSDMNGYGHFVQPLLWSTLYWLGWAVLLGVISSLLARHGSEVNLRARLAAAKQSLPAYVALLALPVLIIIGSGSWYYYNTHVLNPFLTDKDTRKLQADYEKLYKKYERVTIPKVTAVDTHVDIYPEKRSFHATGVFSALNKSDKPIPDIYITNGTRSVKNVSFDRPATATLSDTVHGFWVYHLATPLAPGEAIQIKFECAYANPGFRNNGEEAQFAYNGTFFDLSYFPQIGYDGGREINNPVRRKEAGLPAQEELPDRGDTYGMNTNLFSPYSDFITYHTVVSTTAPQIAISPGYLARQWQQDGRNFY